MLALIAMAFAGALAYIRVCGDVTRPPVSTLEKPQ